MQKLGIHVPRAERGIVQSTPSLARYFDGQALRVSFGELQEVVWEIDRKKTELTGTWHNGWALLDKTEGMLLP